MKLLFACDLDNTVLYSYKYKQTDDICVELLDGREQSYMPKKSCDMLKALAGKANLIPITTRSVEQYNRIKWPDGTTPEYALTTNGSVFLENGRINNEWIQISELSAKPAMAEMIKLREYLTAQDKLKKCRIVDDMYLFAVCRDGVDAEKCADEYRLLTSLDVFYSGRKIYFFPYGIDKGSALIRLKHKFNPIITVCAGDSNIDIPMLNAADIAIVPTKSLAERITAEKVYISSEDVFPNFVLSTVSKISSGIL